MDGEPGTYTPVQQLNYAAVVLKFDICFPCSEGTVRCHLTSIFKHEIDDLGKTELSYEFRLPKITFVGTFDCVRL